MMLSAVASDKVVALEACTDCLRLLATRASCTCRVWTDCDAVHWPYRFLSSLRIVDIGIGSD